MYTKSDIIKGIVSLGINPSDTLLIHSSMKAIGEVEGGAETVLDAFIEYMEPGLLIFPTHTWAQMKGEHLIFNPLTEPSCVGILTNLFMKRPNAIRSWHPTHSVAAIGKNAEEYVKGEEKCSTPCPPDGCWGRLYDLKAKILFLGCSMSRNTFIHYVEELNNIPNRLSEDTLELKIHTPTGELIDRPMRYHKAPIRDISQNYGKLKPAFIYKGIAREGYICDAPCVVADAVGMADLTSKFLKINPDLFIDDKPIPCEWYMEDLSE